MRYLVVGLLLCVCGSVSAQGFLDRVRNRLENGPILGPLLDPVAPPTPLQPGLVVERPILGLQAEERVEDGVSSVYVETVQPDSAADQAGLQPGDQIAKLGEKEISSIEDITLFMTTRQVGDAIEITALRDGTPVIATATLRADPTIVARPPLLGTAPPPEIPSLPAPGAVADVPVDPGTPEVRGTGERDVRGEGDGDAYQHGRLGVVVEDEVVPPAGSRARVVNVVPGSPAAVAGINVGDQILSIDGIAIEGAMDLQARMRTTRPGQEVEVAIGRGNTTSRSVVRLMGTSPLPAAAAAAPRETETELRRMVRQLRQQVESLEKRVAELEARP